MGPWTRFLFLVSARETGRRSIEIQATLEVTPDYPGKRRVAHLPRDRTTLPTFSSTRVGLASDLLRPPREWREALKNVIGPDSLIRVHIVLAGGPAWQRRVLELNWSPWFRTLPFAIASFARGEPARRPGLEIPIRVSSTRGSAELAERIDDFVARVNKRGWVETSRGGHIAFVHNGDRFESDVAPRTRLVIVEREPDEKPLELPARATYSLLQIAGTRAERIAFCRMFLRGIMHDAPIDAAAWEGIRASRLPSHALSLDLFDGDEHALRLRQALYDVADGMATLPTKILDPGTIRGRAVRAPRNGPKSARPHVREVAEVIERNVALDFSGTAKAIEDTADTLVFSDEEHGVAATHEAFTSAQAPLEAYEDAAKAAEALGELANTEGRVRPRHASMWLTGYDSEKVLFPAEPIKKHEPYKLRFVIDSRMRVHAATSPLPERALRKYFKDRETLDLLIVLFCDPAKLQLGKQIHKLTLRRWGPTDEIDTACVGLDEGVHQVRACIMYRGNLLQTVVMQVGVEKTGGTRSAVDYSGMTNFVGLEQLPETGYALFVNDTQDRHWIGVYAESSSGLGALKPADLAIASKDAFERHSKALRNTLAEIEGANQPLNRATYRFAVKPPNDTERLARDNLLVSLAADGRRMYSEIFENANVGKLDELDRLQTVLEKPDQVISITRLDDHSSMPWAMTYDLPINPAAKLVLCPRFRDKNPATGATFAESPRDCSDRAECPHKTKFDDKTVCPFGFWGFRHQLELHLRPADTAETALDRVRIDTTSGASAFTAAFNFPGMKSHLDAVKTQITATDPTSNSEEALVGLRRGDVSLYYFFCHGESEDNNIRIKLSDPIGQLPAQLLESSSIMVGERARKANWDLDTWRRVAPLIFFNACESIVLDARSISPFLDRFVSLGASGMIGTEIPVFTTLAEDVGVKIIALMVGGATLGEALLRIRRTMLGAGNPMALAYSVFGSAALHFHGSGGKRCPSCPS